MADVKIIADRSDIVAIADAVRGKAGTTGEMTLSQIATNINNLEAGSGSDLVLQTKEITVTENGTVEVTPDSGYDGLSNIVLTVNVASGSGSGVTLPETGVASDGQITDTWEQIIEAINQGVYKERYAIRNYKTLNLSDGTTVNMEIAAFDTDRKPDDTFAAITWISKAAVAKRAINSSSNNTGGWEATTLRTWLKGTFYSYLPTEVQNAITTVRKTFYNDTTGTEAYCDDTIWIPSHLEVFNEATYESSGWAYTDYFTNTASRIKTYSGSALQWWLRTAHPSSKYFRAVSSAGNGAGTTATNSYGIVIGFCT